MNSMTTKSAIIVGAGPGLGMAMAHRFGRDGYRIGLVAKDDDVLDKMRHELQSSGVTVAIAQADVTDAQALRGAIGVCSSKNGDPDIVFSNTSFFVEATPTKVSLELFELTFKIACVSTLITLQTIAPLMTARGHGTLLVPGTALAIKPWPPGAALGAAKAAARNLTMAAHEEVKSAGMHVCMITIDGMIKEDTAFSPRKIAEKFWEVSQAKRSEWVPEVVFAG